MRKPGPSRMVAGRATIIAATRVGRQRVRRKLGSLKSLRVHSKSERRYVLAYARVFLVFADQQLAPVRDVTALDQGMSQYVESCWEEGEPKHWASDALAGLQYVAPTAKGKLPLSWSMVAAGNRFERPDRALPFTPQMPSGIAGSLVLMGFPRFAAGCIVAFKVMMRTVELRDITIDDVAVDLHHFHAVLRLRDTKAGGRAGIFESVVIEDPVTVRCVRYLCRDRSPGERLVVFSDSKLRWLLHRAAKLLEMESWGLRPYSLRRGGATWRFREYGPHEQVAQLGR